MTKISLITACAIVLSGSTALAQGYGVPPGPNSGPGGASGAAPTRDVGTQPSVGNTPSDATTSSTMTQQRIKEMNAGQTAAGNRYYDRGTYGYDRGTYGQRGAYNQQQATAPMESPSMGCGSPGSHSVAITDEYGFKYDSCGDRLNARGNVISPHTR
jgi:hypothetical protein